MECRQAVLTWLSDEDPIGIVLPPILVAWGSSRQIAERHNGEDLGGR